MVAQTPEQAYQAVLNVRAWWSGLHAESFEGNSERVGDEFSFLAGGGAHYTKQKLIELVPGKKVVWLVTEANLNFVDKTDEWKGTRFMFEISSENGKTKIVFTHVGLVPEFECYDSCAPAWTRYVHERLTAVLENMNSSNYTTSFLVDQTMEEVFSAVNNVRGWWSENIEGHTDKAGGEFFYANQHVHFSKMRIVEYVPYNRIVWLVLDNYFDFTQHKGEWKGDKIVFAISTVNGRTELRFTQEGLVPACECYDVCCNAWTGYIQKSLYSLITTGEGNPNPKENDINDEFRGKMQISIS
jgi:hypothetical protein